MIGDGARRTPSIRPPAADENKWRNARKVSDPFLRASGKTAMGR